MIFLLKDKPLAVAVVQAIRTGDVLELKRLLAENPELVHVRIIGSEQEYSSTGASRTLLHIATDWPGHFPNGAATVTALVEAGAEVNARFTGPHTETPLHWAASNDDIEVIDALLGSGADIEADGAVIAGGTPLDDAVAFGQWKAARRLVERGARLKLWHAAALGVMERVEEFFNGETPPSDSDITSAFWQACHGNQRQAAEYLLDRGAYLNWVGYDGLTPLDIAARNQAVDLVEWLTSQGAKSAADPQ
ncbi:ankyrin repeat domain-containing protein [Paenibacillus sp. sptzw28]|nr:ankyrin repeat domain-containing protein [Paenibacillus sp. sptzw28]